MLPQRIQDDQEKSLFRSFAEKKLKQHGNKVTKKIAKKGAKISFKLLKAAALKVATLLTKLLVWLASTVGLPVIGIGLLIIIAIVVISLSYSYFFGTGEGLEGEDMATHEYIVERANSTVNMMSDIERPYRVPEKLIAATIQLESFQKNDVKGIIKKMSTELSPNFEYGKYDEWKEKQIIVYEDGKLVETGEIQHTDNLVTKLDYVEYWNGTTTFKYTAQITDWMESIQITHKTIQIPKQKDIWAPVWVSPETVITTDKNYPFYDESSDLFSFLIKQEQQQSIGGIPHPDNYIKVLVEKKVTVMVDKVIEVKTITKTRQQFFTSNQSTNTDYAKLDNILNSYGMGFNDKRLIESNYLFLGGTITYSEWLQTMGVGDLGFMFFDGTIIPGGGVPAQFMPFYLAAERKYGVHWYVLAAIHFVETGFSTHPTMLSSVGAIGHLQFMPATWCGWSYNIGGGLVSLSTDITSVSAIADGGGYGVDANGDGKADPWDVEDAIHSAAYYLSKNGYDSDPRNAIWHYNHANWYVNKVLTNAERFKTAATYEGGGEIPPVNPGSFMRPAVGRISSPFGIRWGKMHYGIDIASGGINVPIVASADGVVSRSNYGPSYGNVVFIKHNINGQTFETVYAHMLSRAVAVGAVVKQGQFIGYMGTTGDSTGIHLHFEFHLNGYTYGRGTAVNPALVVPF